MRLSDHRPVSASFAVGVAADDAVPAVEFLVEGMCWAAGEESSVAYRVSEGWERLLRPWDWIGLFRVRGEALRNTGDIIY